jgi:HEPN domain-containing protein
VTGRAADWLGQAERDLAHARNARASGDHEWACFAAQQAAEKALKAVIFAKGGQPWGHSALGLARALPASIAPPRSVLDSCRDLDKFYVTTRYPNGFPQGKPGDYFSDQDCVHAIQQAETVLEFCRRHVP